jgi:hypothetical protein
MPDFLTSLTHHAEAELLINPEDEHRVPRSADTFRQAWLKSSQRRNLWQEIRDYEASNPVNDPGANDFKQSKAYEKSSL